MFGLSYRQRFSTAPSSGKLRAAAVAIAPVSRRPKAFPCKPLEHHAGMNWIGKFEAAGQFSSDTVVSARPDNQSMNIFRFALITLLAVAALSACGGSGNSSTTTGTPMPAPVQRGDLVNGPPTLVGTYSPDELLAILGGNDLGKTLLGFAYSPLCTISVYHYDYETVDPAGNLTVASGALMIPSGSDTGCTGGRPMLLYAHATTTDRNYDISKFAANGDGEGMVLAAVFAAEGYIVVAPNEVGYDVSTLDYHPYLIADQQSKDMIDALTAARTALPNSVVPGTTDGGKLFITGYSEGGYVAMATQRAMQAAGMTVTASGPMSGPYALSAFSDALFEGQVNNSGPKSLALVIVAYQKAYGDIYATPGDVFAPKYAPTIEGLFPGLVPVSTLTTEGLFPVAAFSSTPPTPAYAIYTPAVLPANLAGIFAAGFGTDYLIINTYREAYINDALASPDTGFPVVTDDLPPANPQNTFRIRVKANDLRNWEPTAPTLLCGGNSDPEVFFFNTTLMQIFWGSHPPAVAPVILDIDSPVVSGDPYGSEKTGFAVAKALVAAAAVASGATDGGAAAVLLDYHAGLVPPFCLSAVKAFFDGH
jgi:Prolyl oligopeptidase family